jgi:hypothetical protein
MMTAMKEALGTQQLAISRRKIKTLFTAEARRRQKPTSYH